MEQLPRRFTGQTITDVSVLYLSTVSFFLVYRHGSYLNVASAFNNLLARLKNDAEKNKISAFIETNKAVLGTAAYDSIKRGLDDYEANKQFTTKNRDEIRDFLKKKADGGAATVLVNVSLIVSLVMFALSRQ